MKTLEDAIGCWTIDGLPAHAKCVSKWTAVCTRLTKRGAHPDMLLSDLYVLEANLASMLEQTRSAVIRCKEIINNNETGHKD